MLGDIALRGADRIDDILYADFLIAHHAENLQAQRM